MRDWNEIEITATLDVIYDAAVSPARWEPVLEQLSRVFRSHFVDIFARSDDFSQYKGRAIGLDRADYEDVFLGFWCNRNIWSQTNPVRVAGEVLSTRQMVERAELERSPIYNEYLRHRNLDEGLRLSLSADHGWISDISLLRSSSTGCFEPAEIALGKYLLPHLQRAVAVSRKLQGAAGFGDMDTGGRAAILLDEGGRVLQMNATAEASLDDAGPLKIKGGVLTGSSERSAARLSRAIALASRIRFAEASEVEMFGSLQATITSVAVQPVREQAGWGVPGPRAVLVLTTGKRPVAENAAKRLASHYGLTPTEAVFALSLAAGDSLAEIAASTGRSIHTVRSHLAHVMTKTRTQRQSQLVALVIGATRSPELVDQR